jgi:hypothetical protein
MCSSLTGYEGIVMDTRLDGLNDFVKVQREGIEKQFSAQVETLCAVAQELGAGPIAKNLKSQSSRLSAERFELMVAGRFKVGKSTFLNALLASASRVVGLGTENGLLPVDTLPCTAVLTRIEYAETPFVRAKFFDGRTEDWSFDRYLEEARIYGETAMTEENATDTTLARVASFDLGLPVELLKRGLILIDSPGVSEDVRRTAVARDALRDIHAGIVMLRSDMLGGTDEIDFALEVIEHTGRTFPVVNMFHGGDESERFKAVLNNRTSRLRTEGDLTKLENQIYLVDCKQAFDGYRNEDGAKVRRSGMQKLERRLAEFLVHGAYFAKVRSAVDGTVKLVALLKDEAGRLRIALKAEQKQFQATLDSCDADMQEINDRRDRVESILERTTRRAVSDAADSYRDMCRDLEASIGFKFQQRPIESLSTTKGKLAALVTKKASREAAEILHSIIDDHVREWAEAPPTARGLQRDLTSAIEEGRSDLDEQYAGIDARLADISVKIGEFDLEFDLDTSTVQLKDRLASAALGFVLFGPLGVPLTAAGGWRSVVGGTLSAVAAKVALGLALGAFGLALGPVAAFSVLISSVLVGGTGAALIGLEDRVRKNALKLILGKLRDMVTNDAAVEGLKTYVGAALKTEADQVMEALDAVLEQQRDSLVALREASGTSIEEKEARLLVVARAEDSLKTSLGQLAEIAELASRESVPAN